MGMDESMTKQETKEMMEQLEKVFSIVRILDVEGFEKANSLRKKKIRTIHANAIHFGTEINAVKIVFQQEY